MIREIRNDDLPGIQALLDGLDEQSRLRRWFTGGADINGAVRWAMQPERYNAVGLVALAEDGEIIGHAACADAGEGRAEVCFEVAAAWRHHGIAGHLLEALAQKAAGRGITTLVAEVLSDNQDMLAVLREHGALRTHRDGGVVEYAVSVEDAQAASHGCAT